MKQDEAKDKIAVLHLIANILGVAIGISTGYMMDRMKVWKILVCL